MSDPLHIELVGGAENVFLVDECSDPIEHFLVRHAVLLHWRAPPILGAAALATPRTVSFAHRVERH